MNDVKHSMHYSRAHYFRTGRVVSWAALLFSASAWSQYQGQVAKTTKDAPALRAVAVFEWTGEESKPGVPGKIKTGRLVPVSIFNGEKLEDAGIYLARPQPMALAGEVEYQMKKNGATVGLFDVKNAGQEMGSWVGYGEWKAPPAARPAFAATAQKLDEDDTDDDKPVLHRKRHADDQQSSGSNGTASSGTGAQNSSSGSNSGASSGSSSGSGDDSDRPVLHKKDSSDSSGTSSGNGAGNSAGNGSGAAQSDSDRPVMKKSQKQEDEDIGHAVALPGVTDPDRPRLQRGKDNSQSLKVLPSLMGMPSDMRQTVGVSDAKDHPDHPWSYTWADSGDEAKMRAALEDQARIALGLASVAQKQAAASSTAKRSSAGTVAKKTTKPAAQPAPVTLEAEQFRVFELAYGSGATLVFSAGTSIAPDRERYVTLIAQPDLYGGIRILFKSVADSVHLDETPRMILVDAVDALADNRGELLFELRGATQRQFALFRVTRGVAEQIFVTNGTAYGSISGD
jgi:uncharacterized membrane protein YgcG